MSKNLPKQWLGLAASFIIPIYFLVGSQGHDSQQGWFKASHSARYLCFSGFLGCDFFSFCQYTQAKVQSNMWREIICLSLFFLLLTESLFSRQNLI